MTNSLSILANLATVGAKTIDDSRPKLVFAMDATASREPSWAVARQIQGAMFDVAEGLLNVQLVYFGGEICHASGFAHTAGELRELMNSVHCQMGGTQIRDVLSHCITQHAQSPIAALVYIGDCVEHSDRTSALHYAQIVGTLGIRGFWFHDKANNSRWSSADTSTDTTYFQSYAKATNGAYAEFNESSVELLKELLAGVAAYATGGLAALANQGTGGARLMLEQLK